MDDRIRLFLYALSGAGGFGLVGALFGGLAGAVFRASGRAAGGFLGATAVAALERVSGRELPRSARGALTGATDGAFFLAVVGSLVGLYAAYHDGALSRVWVYAGAAALLALGAALFGGLAYLLVGMSVRAFNLILLGMVAGALAGAVFAGELVLRAAAVVSVRLDAGDGAFYGALSGAVLGGTLAGGLAAWWGRGQR
jgi:hypothetical protein